MLSGQSRQKKVRKSSLLWSFKDSFLMCSSQDTWYTWNSSQKLFIHALVQQIFVECMNKSHIWYGDAKRNEILELLCREHNAAWEYVNQYFPTIWSVYKGNQLDRVTSFWIEVTFEMAPEWQAGTSGSCFSSYSYCSVLPALILSSRLKNIIVHPASTPLLIWSSFSGMGSWPTHIK